MIKITREDNRYMTLARQYIAGDKSVEKELQQMVDRAAKAAGYSILAYRGHQDTKNLRRSSNTLGFFTSSDYKVATVYAREPGGHVDKFYLKLTKPYEMDNDERQGFELDRDREPLDDWIKQVKSWGFDGIIITPEDNYIDNYDEQTATKYVLFDPEQAKSAALVIFDDRGEVIPLSKRFNAQVSDIRESRLAEESKLTERSYSEQDIPEYFYLATELVVDSPVDATSLSKHMFKGCRGISSQPYIFRTAWDLNPHTNTLLQMDGNQVLAKNKLSRVVYSNLDYLVSNNFKTLTRVLDMDYTWCMKELFGPKHGKVLETIFQKSRINSINDIIKVGKRNGVEINKEDLSNALTLLVKQFLVEEEEEWIVKDTLLKIPINSLIVYTNKLTESQKSKLRNYGYRVKVILSSEYSISRDMNAFIDHYTVGSLYSYA